MTIKFNESPRWQAYITFWWLFLATLLFDQATKLWIVHGSGYLLGHVPPQSGTTIIPGFLNFIYMVNYGAAWGIGEGFGLVFTLIAVGVLYAIFYFRRAFEVKRLPYQVAFGLITPGIVGNAIDRLLRGHVVDFIDVNLQFYRWPTFNIADCGIVVGTLWMLTFSTFFDRKEDQRK